jgi:Cysteine dioxygenase type I
MTRRTPLLRAELRLVVERVLLRPAAWRSIVGPDPTQRTFAELHRDDRYNAWVICWNDDADTGYHDHDTSNGAVAVASGEVIEERLVLGGPPRGRHFSAGQIFDFEASEIHRVRHGGGGPAVTIHAYSPPLQRMGAYVVEPSGALRREVIDESEELRPLAATL